MDHLERIRLVKVAFDRLGMSLVPTKDRLEMLATFIACASAEMTLLGATKGALESLNAAANCVRSLEQADTDDAPDVSAIPVGKWLHRYRAKEPANDGAVGYFFVVFDVQGNAIALLPKDFDFSNAQPY